MGCYSPTRYHPNSSISYWPEFRGPPHTEAPIIGAFFAQVADMMRNQPG